jgi:enoyl-CoA hydratase/carnithine racemase
MAPLAAQPKASELLSTAPGYGDAVLGPDVMGSAAAAELLEGGVVEDEVGPLTERPVLLVHLDDRASAARVASMAPACVVVGIATTAEQMVDPPALDVLLATDASAARPWVGHPEGVEAAIATVRTAVARGSIAATTLVQLLRTGATLDVTGALVAESLAYSTLQSGPAFRAWLADAPDRPAPRDDGAPVLVERDGDTLTITLNRPSVRNAYNAAMRDGLVEALRLVAVDSSITSAEVRGAGASFCSGGDLREFGTLPDPATAHVIRTSRSAAALVHRCRDRVRFRVHGACVGAGMELPAFSSRVVASLDATFRLPEVGMGLVPGAGGTASIPRRIGRQRAAWLALTGSAIDAPTALDWGLVDEIETPDGTRV